MSSGIVSDDLAVVLNALGEVTTQQAMQSLNGTNLNILERKAVTLVEKLRVLRGPVEYTASRLAGRIVAALDAGDLWKAHPNNCGSLDELLHIETGMSRSEKSDTLFWEKHIYPYLEGMLGVKPYEAWEATNKTKRRRMVRFLRPVLDEKPRKVPAEVQDWLEQTQKEVGPDTKAIVSHFWEQVKELDASALERPFWDDVSDIEMLARKRIRSSVDNETGEVSLGEIYDVTFTASSKQIGVLLSLSKFIHVTFEE
jgi:hypothetical protein